MNRPLLLLLVLLGTLVTLPGAATGQSSGEDTRAGPFLLRGNGPHRLRAQAGVFDLLEEGKNRLPKGRSFAGGLEVRLGTGLLHWRPALGLFAHHDGGLFGYGGFYLDLAIGRWTLSPLLTLGGYRRGDGKELGGVFQFRSGASLTYELTDGQAVGLSFTHISNASIHDENPGAEILFVVYEFPAAFPSDIPGW